ncbi:hypothetical protein [Absidia glauca]|uniref:Ndc10 domain-containing protein n=1 Tax=Absidia glauca TaxID=4829 RepID=A0A163JXF3_ABSGL|nr:hypothetical protein [Absidia glauca]
MEEAYPDKGLIWHSWDSIRNEDKTAPPGTEMALLFPSGIDQQVPLFSWYQVQQKTHINYGSSACLAGNVCANVDQIRRQGRWSNTTINGAYLTNLPRELVRSMAGFPTYVRFFYLACAALYPPTSLCKKLCRAIGE